MSCQLYPTLIQIHTTQGVFVLAVTYNCEWSKGEFDNWAVDSGRLSYALSLVSRMASVFYGIDFQTIVAEMRKQMASFPLTRIDQAEYLIRSFVTYMANKVHKDRTIDTFVLLIDEALAMEELILKRYPNCPDVTSCARTALLNKDITFNGGAFKTALTISSLAVSPIQETKSSRAIKALVLPSKLNPTDVVTKIWESDAKNYPLIAIAGTVHDLPRCVEIVMSFIKSNPSIVDKKFVKELFDYLDSEIKSKYSTDGASCPSDELLGALILGDGVDLDSETVECISRSIITNSLETFSGGQRLEKPEMSLALIRYFTSMGNTKLAKAISGGITAIIGWIPFDGGEGFIWEKAYYEWMKIRLVAVSNYVPKANVPSNRKVMNIMKIFGITDVSIVPLAHFDMLSAPLGSSKNDIPYWQEYNLTNNSHKKPKSFLEEIDSIALSAQSPIAILSPATGESFDLCLKILVPGYDEAMHVFVENKAIAETQNNTNKVPYNMANNRESKGGITVKDLEDGGKQYIHTETVMKGRKILFIYARTQKSVSYGINNAIELGREHSFDFLGPLTGLYQSAKSASTPKGK